ncbi:hypothetical protein BJX76DRAFT_352016 [Aspergillus varians]
MKPSTAFGAIAALFAGNAVAQVTITIPGLPTLPTISVPTISIPSTVSIPNLPTMPVPSISIPTTPITCLPSIPTTLPQFTWPTLMAAIPTAKPDINEKRSVNSGFERTHPRQMAPVDV